MNIYDYAFYIVSYLAVPIWLLMILFPKWSGAKKLLSSVYILLPFTLPYAILVLFHFSDILIFLNPTPEKIAELLTHHYSVVLAWIHFIPIDLFFGRWIYHDSRQRDVNVYVMAPVLTLCFLLPPLGISIYLITRLISGAPGAAELTKNDAPNHG